MSKGQRYQCSQCGTLQWSKQPFDIEDDLYIRMECKHCGKTTSHLWVGDKEEDLYTLYDVVSDSRFYNYRTK